MRRPLIAGIVLVASSLAFAETPGAAAPARDLAGNYKAQGVGVGGANYKATVAITRTGETYLLRWTFGDGHFDGVGLLNGDVLSVGWSHKDKAGVIVYTVKGDTLEGRWADLSTSGKVLTETLTRQP